MMDPPVYVIGYTTTVAPVPHFQLDSFCAAPWSRGGSALKVSAQRSTLVGWGAFERGRVKIHSPSRTRAPRALHGGADTGV